MSRTFCYLIVLAILIIIIMGIPDAASKSYIAPTPTPKPYQPYQYKTQYDKYDLSPGRTEEITSDALFFARIVGKSEDGSYFIVSRSEFDSTLGTFIARQARNDWNSYRAMDCVVVRNNEIVSGFACPHYFTIREVK